MEENNVTQNSNGAMEQSQSNIGSGENTGVNATGNTERSFKQEDVNKIVTDRLARERAKWENEKKEAEKLAKMTAEERYQHEFKKRDEELTKREKEVAKRELKSKTFETFKKKGIPSELLDLVDYSNEDTCNASIDVLDKVFKAAVSKAVDEKFKASGSTPKTGNTNIKASNDPFVKGLRRK